MTTETRQQLESMERALKSLFDDEQITEDIYFKGLVALAYEYAAAGEINDAALKINKCTREYVAGTMFEQMLEDNLYLETAHQLAEILEQTGQFKAEPEPEFKINGRNGGQA